jgi:hypothetical protein
MISIDVISEFTIRRAACPVPASFLFPCIYRSAEEPLFPHSPSNPKQEGWWKNPGRENNEQRRNNEAGRNIDPITSQLLEAVPPYRGNVKHMVIRLSELLAK